MKRFYLLAGLFDFFFPKKTLGARILIVNDEQVLLIKHTYVPGWYTVGGGVDSKETPRAAVERELMEEVGVTLASAPKLFSVYYNQKTRRLYCFLYWRITQSTTCKLTRNCRIRLVSISPVA